MELTYYDPVHGRRRFKRRVVWGMRGFLVGALAGSVLELILR